jgi:spore maturation protein CgeB
MNISFFGSSLVSSYWNGAATYYRGIIRSLHQRGHRITFYEPDAYERQRYRDIEDPAWATVVVYDPSEETASLAIREARDSDIIVKASGVGVLDEFLEAEVAALKRSTNLVVFWDVDAPATLDRVQANADDPFHRLISQYDAILTYGGGAPVVQAYRKLGANVCIPIYNALDPETHWPVAPDPRFAGDVAFLGNRLPDRESRVDEFFFKPARQLPMTNFVLGGSGWDDKAKTSNVTYLRHIYTKDHNAFNCSSRTLLNISRESMARVGFSPATRVFEAAGAAACLITDSWQGIELFFEPNKEVLVAADGNQVIEHLTSLDPARARMIGEAAYRRAMAHHTYAQRAESVEQVLEGHLATIPGAAA